MSEAEQRAKPRLVGINHIALEVGDIDAALEFYGRIFHFTLRGRDAQNAFIDMGDQFIALRQTAGTHQDAHRHVGIVVDDREGIVALIQQAGGRMVEGPFLDFLDPWGNRIEVVDYRDIQFTKAPDVLHGMGLSLEKRPKALEELQRKGMAPGS
jgi:catechol 2,3-dioxygenase-like lactoylglutathione lyase family enzyme